MGLDARALTRGPRGRRVCLDFALLDADGSTDTRPDPLAAAVFDAAYDREREAGESVSRIVLTDGGAPAAPAPAARGVEEIAALLAERPLPEASPERLDGVLTGSVDAARYWQGPDGVDRLAAEPALEGALGRAAVGLARTPHTAWWATPVDRDDQWEVGFDGPLRPARIDAALVLREWAAAQAREAERWAAIEERGVPVSGDWWSTPPQLLRRTTRIERAGVPPAGVRFVEDTLGWTEARARRTTIAPTARIHEVDGPESWAWLCRRYPLDVTATRRHDWRRVTGRDGRWLLPDWSRVAADLDGVHLTVAGYLAAAGRPIAVADEWATMLAGWNPDETVWLDDGAVAATAEVADWRRPDGRGWERA